MTKRLALAAVVLFALFAGKTDEHCAGGKALVFANGGITFANGISATDLAALANAYGRHYAYFERNGHGYVITDPDTLDRIAAVYAPQLALGSRQAALGQKQAAIGMNQAKSGMEQARLGIQQVHDDSRATERRQQELSKQQDTLGEKQDALGREQTTMGHQQEEMSRAAVGGERSIAPAFRRGEQSPPRVRARIEAVKKSACCGNLGLTVRWAHERETRSSASGGGQPAADPIGGDGS